MKVSHITVICGFFVLLTQLFFIVDDQQLEPKTQQQIMSQSSKDNPIQKPNDIGETKNRYNKPIKQRKNLDILRRVSSRTYKSADKIVKETLVVERNFIYPNIIVRDIVDSKGQHFSSVVADHFLVSFDGLSESEVKDFVRNNKLKIRRKMLLESTYILSFEDFSFENRDRVMKKLRDRFEVSISEEDHLVFTSAQPDDSRYHEQWALNTKSGNSHIQAEKAWEINTDCSDIAIAVIDSGIDEKHPDLKDNLMLDKAYNAIKGDVNDYGVAGAHGTHVAGIIAASGNNGLGISGVCHRAKLIPVKAFNKYGLTSVSIITDSIAYVTESTDAKIINASYGRSGNSNRTAIAAIKKFTEKGGLFVAAAGNRSSNNDNTPFYPASYDIPGVISVAATNQDGKLAGFSNYGKKSVDIAAPGNQIISTILNGQYGKKNGTSMAAPIVAGALALAWSLDPKLKSSEMISYLFDSADSGPYEGKIVGNKKLNLASLVNAIPLKVGVESSYEKYVAEERYEIKLDLKGFMSVVDKVEIKIDGQVIESFKPSKALSTYDLVIPSSGKKDLVISVTKKDGTTEDTAIGEIEVSEKIERGIEFRGININETEDGELCKITLSGVGKGRELFKANLASGIICKRFCEVYGPLARSDEDVVECGYDKLVFYKSHELGE